MGSGCRPGRQNICKTLAEKRLSLCVVFINDTCRGHGRWHRRCVANSWHERAFGVGFAGGMSLSRIRNMLHGQQRLIGKPIARRKRWGVRPEQLSRGILACLRPETDPGHANVATLMEVALVAIARAGELAATRTSMAFDNARLPSRADVTFRFSRDALPVGCTVWIINSKARGHGFLEKLPVHLPMRGKHLSPGLALYHLFRVDPVPTALHASTPLFRNPRTGAVLTVDFVRATLRSCLTAIGRDPSLYGAHSLRIGGATALAWLKVPGEEIQAAGRWHSGAYLRYLRETQTTALTRLTQVASADTDDAEADFVDIDSHEFSTEDEA